MSDDTPTPQLDAFDDWAYCVWADACLSESDVALPGVPVLRQEKDENEKTDARVDAMGDSQDNPTASTNEAIRARAAWIESHLNRGHTVTKRDSWCDACSCGATFWKAQK